MHSIPPSWPERLCRKILPRALCENRVPRFHSIGRRSDGHARKQTALGTQGREGCRRHHDEKQCCETSQKAKATATASSLRIVPLIFPDCVGGLPRRGPRRQRRK